MKASKEIKLGLLISIVASITGCEEEFDNEPKEENVDTQHCVSENGIVVNDWYCDHDVGIEPLPLLVDTGVSVIAGDSSPSSGDGMSESHSHSSTTINLNPIHIGYRWYYGGTNGVHISPGVKINSGGGGSYTPSAGKSYVTPSRGGFGGIGGGKSAGG